METTEQLRRYTLELIRWNRSVSNLVSRHDEPRFLERHLLESLEVAAWIRQSGAKHCLDFGSGGGLPAVPLAIAGVGEAWLLVESRRMKTLFLRKMLENIKLDNVEVVCSRLEALEPRELAHPEPITTFTSRATAGLVSTLIEASRFVASGGSAFLWKGAARDDEMGDDARWQSAWEFERAIPIGNGVTSVSRFIRK